jgi:two-component system cell cycle response regulator
MCARVLVVDDEPVNLDLVEYLLRAFGHEPIVALGGESALRLANERVPDLVLCDIQMSQMDGFEVLRRLREDPRFAKTPVVGVTALAMVGDRERVLAAGFDGYVTKPITPETFVLEIEQYLAPELALRQQPKRAMGVAGPAPAPPLRGGSGYVLVVDNDPPNRELLRHLIESLGVETRLASNADDALLLAREMKPNLIISDLHMPGRGGLELLQVTKSDAILKDVPFLLTSSSAPRREEERRARESGVAGFLVRPLDAEAMLEHLAKWIPAGPQR